MKNRFREVFSIRFLIQGNDLRMKYLCQKLIAKGFEAEEFREFPAEPVYFIASPGKNPEQLIELIKGLAPGSILLGAQKSKNLYEQAEISGVKFLNIMEDEAFAVQNAVPTAEGALSVILANTECVLRGLDVAITGYGRIGKVLAPMLKCLGANVHVIARNPVDRAWAMGLKTCDLNAMQEELRSCKVLINTVPSQIIDENALRTMPKGSLLIELASPPYGFDVKAAEALGHKAVMAQALPAKSAPESAADYLADAVLRLIFGYG